MAGIVIGATAAASAAVPSLPPRTAAQLLADVASAARRAPGPYTATVQQTASPGLPQLPATGPSGAASSSLLSGTQRIDVWYADPQHVRVAVPVQAGESDARLDGRTLWLWNSKTQTATRVTLPSRAPIQHGNGAAGSSGTSAGAPPLPPTPQAAASQLLHAIGPTTVVSVQSPVYVANRPAYQLSLAPISKQSLVRQVLIAIDASRGIPLQVEVYARDESGVAYSIGFSKLSFRTPRASNFAFTPPPGATVKKETVPASPSSLLQGLGLPVSPAAAPPSGAKPKVIGSGWLSVVATPASTDVAAAVHQLLTAPRGSSRHGLFGSSSASAAPSSSASGQPAVPVGPYLAPLQSLLAASGQVSGSWGKGWLLHTALLNVLVTSNGQILAGAVSRDVLYADVARDAG